jgi:hypothetical protein
VLPEAFWKPNDQHVRGGIELAFMSTTTDRAVALNYAKGDAIKSEGKPSIVFEMQMGMIDRCSYSYCTHTIPYCNHTVLILYSSYCTYTVLLMGMINRGAPLQWCSQFPAEEEILFAPLTGLEVVGTPTHTALILHSYCTHTALILHSYSTHDGHETQSRTAAVEHTVPR